MRTHYVIMLKDSPKVKELANMAIGRKLWGGRLYKAIRFQVSDPTQSHWEFGFEGTFLNYLRMKKQCKGVATIFRL